MDASSFIGPVVVAAIISGIVTGAGILISARATRSIHKEKLGFDAEQSIKKAEYDRAFVDWERKALFAEDVLAECYQIRDLIAGTLMVHNVLSNIDSKALDERARVAGACLEISKEFEKHSSIFANFEAKRFRYEAYFQQEHNPVSVIAVVRDEIALACSVLKENSETAHQHEDLFREMVGFGATTDVEAIHTIQRLNEAVKAIEETCRRAMNAASGWDGSHVRKAAS